MILALLAWASTIAVLTTYYAMTTNRLRPVWFDLANALGAPALIVQAVLLGAYPSAAVTAAFGLVGAIGLFSKRRKRETAA